VRDSRKDESYFKGYRNYLEKRISKYLGLQKDIEQLDSVARVNVPWALFEFYIKKIEIDFSLGYSLGDLKVDTQESLKWLLEMERRGNQLELREDKVYFAQKRDLTLNNYYFYLYWLTFAKAVDLDLSLVKEAISIMAQVGVDRLFDLIMVQLGDKNRKIGEKVRHPKIFKKLLSVVEAPEARATRTYEGYISMVGMLRPFKAGLNDNHAKDSRISTTRGYWCYEAALVVMLWNIDDSSFRNNPYYPKDLVRKL
jgi:hypothetical protein